MQSKVDANRPGKVPGSGRKKGTPNKATADIRALAQVHGKMAIDTLVDLLQNAETEATRVAAAKELLDRGYGRSTQPVDMTVNLHEQALDLLDRTAE